MIGFFNCINIVSVMYIGRVDIKKLYKRLCFMNQKIITTYEETIELRTLHLAPKMPQSFLYFLVIFDVRTLKVDYNIHMMQ